MLGMPLQLQLHRLANPTSGPPWQLNEWQVAGDLHGRLAWVVGEAATGGCDLTCRWEIDVGLNRHDTLRALACVLLERSHFRRMRACARAMGKELGCTSTRLREWSGLAHR